MGWEHSVGHIRRCRAQTVSDYTPVLKITTSMLEKTVGSLVSNSDGKELQVLLSLASGEQYSQEPRISNTANKHFTNMPLKGCITLLNKVIFYYYN